MALRVFLNGSLFDGLQHLRGEALATRDSRIIAVGHPDDVRRVAGPRAEEVDLDGGLLAPGFQDAHVHPLIGGLEQLRCDLSGLSSRQEYLDAVARHAREHPDTPWLRGGGWPLAAFAGEAPTVADLDAVVPDRPVFLPSSDHHDAWVNSAALEVAGVDRNTPDLPDGWLVRDEQGRPHGTLREAAMALVGDHLPTTREEYADALRHAQRLLHSLGITGWHDALLGGYAGIDDPTEAYRDLLGSRELVSKVRGALWWDRHCGVEQVEELVERREELARHGFDAGTVKLMADGISETGTAAVTEPYRDPLGCPCGDRGLPHRRAVRRGGHGGRCGRLPGARPRDRRPRRPRRPRRGRARTAEQRHERPPPSGRAPAAGASGGQTTLPSAGCGGEPRGTLGGPADSGRAAARAAPRRGTTHLAVSLRRHRSARWSPGRGSDWPVNTPDPLRAIHALVNRRGPGAGPTGRALLPGQSLTPAQAFATYTSGSAFANHRDDTGHLQVGARADLVVLDRDPFAAPVEEIAEAAVVTTYLDGSPVFTR